MGPASGRGWSRTAAAARWRPSRSRARNGVRTAAESMRMGPTLRAAAPAACTSPSHPPPPMASTRCTSALSHVSYSTWAAGPARRNGSSMWSRWGHWQRRENSRRRAACPGGRRPADPRRRPAQAGSGTPRLARARRPDAASTPCRWWAGRRN